MAAVAVRSGGGGWRAAGRRSVRRQWRRRATVLGAGDVVQVQSRFRCQTISIRGAFGWFQETETVKPSSFLVQPVGEISRLHFSGSPHPRQPPELISRPSDFSKTVNVHFFLDFWGRPQDRHPIQWNQPWNAVLQHLNSNIIDTPNGRHPKFVKNVCLSQPKIWAGCPSSRPGKVCKTEMQCCSTLTTTRTKQKAPTVLRSLGNLAFQRSKVLQSPGAGSLA